MRTLVLWDIDHTLIAVAGLSREIYSAVFRDLVGRSVDHVASMAGRTDRAIMSETLQMNGVAPSEELLTTFATALAEGFAERGSELRRRGRVLPGARAALAALSERADVVQSVLTGNMRSIAVSKLTALDLHGFVDFDVGAYGLEDLERPPLVRLARQRATGKYGDRFDASTTVLVGDTPFDVLAGHRGGARVVAVATGSSDAETLRAAGADVVLPDLIDTVAVVDAILRPSR